MEIVSFLIDLSCGQEVYGRCLTVHKAAPRPRGDRWKLHDNLGTRQLLGQGAPWWKHLGANLSIDSKSTWAIFRGKWTTLGWRSCSSSTVRWSMLESCTSAQEGPGVCRDSVLSQWQQRRKRMTLFMPSTNKSVYSWLYQVSTVRLSLH